MELRPEMKKLDKQAKERLSYDIDEMFNFALTPEAKAEYMKKLDDDAKAENARRLEEFK
jgi:hypothetical protein